MPGVGSADRIAIDVSDRTNISRKYASAVKHAFELPGLDAFRATGAREDRGPLAELAAPGRSSRSASARRR